jgi:putative hydrolase of the HAD superfamily
MIRSTEEKTMKKATVITYVFLDIGGVLLTNRWNHHARKRAATNFKLELAEMEDRNHLTFDTYEDGKLTLEAYSGRVVFPKSDRSPGLSFGASCSRNRNATPR